jgi:serine/threonine protein phosphatase PrpC
LNIPSPVEEQRVFFVADHVPELASLGNQENVAVRLGVRVAHVTDVGRRRRSNQDNHLVLPLGGGAILPTPGQELIDIEKGRLLVAVADGMGGHFGGELASRLCVESLAQEIVNVLAGAGNGQPNLPEALLRAVDVTHKTVFTHAQGYEEVQTMGTTLTAALLHGEHVDLAQVGDSRAYLFREGNLILLTQDQTIGNELRTRGEDSTKVDTQIQDMLTQAVGAQAEIAVAMTAVDLEPRDVLLLCCDGLYKVVSPAEIVETLEFELGLPEKAAHLVTRANDGGGPDNITVILAEICEV